MVHCCPASLTASLLAAGLLACEKPAAVRLPSPEPAPVAPATALAPPAAVHSRVDAAPVPASNAPTGRRKLLREGSLSPVARQLIRSKMRQHGEQMENLFWSALMLDHESARLLADWIVELPRVSRPTGATDDTLNASFPPPFFTFQDEMYRLAARVRDAASRERDDELARDFSALARTCIDCHALYLRR